MTEKLHPRMIELLNQRPPMEGFDSAIAGLREAAASPTKTLDQFFKRRKALAQAVEAYLRIDQSFRQQVRKIIAALPVDAPGPIDGINDEIIYKLVNFTQETADTTQTAAFEKVANALKLKASAVSTKYYRAKKKLKAKNGLNT